MTSKERLMAKAFVSKQFPAAPERVWEIIRHYNGMPAWHPAVKESVIEGSGVGAIRELTFQDGATVRESLDEYDEEARTYSYSIKETSLPVRGYAGSMRVKADDDSNAIVEWTSTFEPEGIPEAEVVNGVESFYTAGLDHLASLL